MLDEITIATNANTTPSTISFPLGRLFMTPRAIEALEEAEQSPQGFISRHARLEQGELCDEDPRENLFSVDKSLRILVPSKPIRAKSCGLLPKLIGQLQRFCYHRNTDNLASRLCLVRRLKLSITTHEGTKENECVP